MPFLLTSWLHKNFPDLNKFVHFHINSHISHSFTTRHLFINSLYTQVLFPFPSFSSSYSPSFPFSIPLSSYSFHYISKQYTLLHNVFSKTTTKTFQSQTSTTMNADCQPLRNRKPLNGNSNGNGMIPAMKGNKQKGGIIKGWLETASFTKWGYEDAIMVLKYHRLPCFFAVALVFFMGVEYTLGMIPCDSPPLDVGFIYTQWLNRVLSSSPSLNTLFAALNTLFVGMQTSYILWVFLVEGRVRPGLAALFMFTCRGILGYSTQLPLPEDFVGSGADFPVGNVSFFLFYSGHVASAVIASLDMRRMQRKELAWAFDFLNVLQMLRLLGSRGHYTIDLAVGVGAGILFDSLAGKYEESRKISVASPASMTAYSPLK